jgi:peptide chain release factor 3
MELEKQRGISVSSTVLQFDYAGCVVNLLDTPGHKDFSEDTYRVLTAVDAALMVIDAGKGVETQTRKLFEVCRRRGVPIFTFMNKCDRPAREPLDLLDELETSSASVPRHQLAPRQRPAFKGVFDRRKHVPPLRARPRRQVPAPVKSAASMTTPCAKHSTRLPSNEAKMELEMLDGAGHAFDRTPMLIAGHSRPSSSAAPATTSASSCSSTASSNSPRRPKRAWPPTARVIEPTDEGFSGFVFKIQANMDPRIATA